MREIVFDRNRQSDLAAVDYFDRSVINSTVSVLMLGVYHSLENYECSFNCNYKFGFRIRYCSFY